MRRLSARVVLLALLGSLAVTVPARAGVPTSIKVDPLTLQMWTNNPDRGGIGMRLGGDGIGVSARLTSTLGSVIGRTLVFTTIDGDPFCSATTGGYGYAYCTRAESLPGSAGFGVVFAGDAEYEASSTAATANYLRLLVAVDSDQVDCSVGLTYGGSDCTVH